MEGLDYVMQSKKQSLIETATSISLGYVISTSAQFLIFPLFGVVVDFYDNILIGLCFTFVSFIRMYLVRRLFVFIGERK